MEHSYDWRMIILGRSGARKRVYPLCIFGTTGAEQQNACRIGVKAMRRPYKADKFAAICEKMKAARPDLAITTDIIVGFPGETEEDFAKTIDCVRQIEFDNSFIFRYSKRKETPAAEMDEQLPEQVKEERNQELLKVQGEITMRKNAALIGTRQEVLCEGPSKTNKTRLSGRTTQNKIVIFDGDAERMTGEIFEIAVEDSTGFTLYGVVGD